MVLMAREGLYVTSVTAEYNYGRYFNVQVSMDECLHPLPNSLRTAGGENDGHENAEQRDTL